MTNHYMQGKYLILSPIQGVAHKLFFTVSQTVGLTVRTGVRLLF